MSEKQNIARAAGILGSATLLSRILGMARDMVVSRLFGAGFATDAFFAAFMIPNMLRRFFAEGALTAAFVPTFAERLEREGMDGARALANLCFTVLTMVMAAVTILGIVFSPWIVGVMFPGFGAAPQKLELTILLNRLMFPYLFFISLVALCMGVLNTVRHFFTPAISTVFLNLAMIGCALLLRDQFDIPIVALAVGVLLGGLLQLALQLPVLWHKGFPLKPNFNLKDPALHRIALLMGPATFGVGVYYLNITVGNILASLLPQGSVSYLYYAQRLFEFPQGIFTVAVAQATLPALSRQAAIGDLDGMKESLNFSLRLTLFITVPALFGLMACSVPLFSLIFMGGAFDYAAAVKSGEALFWYSFGLAFVALARVLPPAFYALKDTRTPVITAFIAFVLNVAFSLLLMKPLLHGGLALATTLSALANMLLLLWLLRRKLGPFGGRAIAVTGLKALLASLPMALLVHWSLTLADWSVTGARLHKGLILGAAVGGGMAVYFGLALLLKCNEARYFGEAVKKKLGRQKQRSGQ